jgi:molybdate transport system substrate-binding protein
VIKYLFLLFIPFSLVADSITIFAASDLKFALDKITKEFLKSHPKESIKLIYGSSGKGRVQIARGAPYDLYFSANMDYVKMLYKKGFIITPPKLYAMGRLVIWSKNENFDPKKGFENLTQPWAKKIAIANPTHAPYGEKAKEALISAKVYDKIKSKIVLGENISQTANFVAIKAADLGIIALSLALAPTVSKSRFHSYYLIPKELHQPLLQGYGITKHAKDSTLATQFYKYFQTNKPQKIMREFGFGVKN